MKIAIDISQIAYEHTGVAQFTKNLVKNLVKIDKKNSYILFGSSLRRNNVLKEFSFDLSKDQKKVMTKFFLFPPVLLDFLWNRIHVAPIEWFIGDVDVFISSDWTQPPTKKAKKATILYDLIIYKYPNETDKKIVKTQKRRLRWVRKECNIIFCISEASKQDAVHILGIDEGRIHVIYAGI